MALLAVAGACARGDGERTPAPGQRLYREGILGSGRPLTAVVEGDVPLLGTQLTCVSCHQRSGMGSTEGATNVPPVTSPILFAPRENPHRRPAYDDASLARAVRDGIDAAGRPLDPLMPRYPLADDDMRALVAYLKTLSADVAPGVTADTVRFATNVSDGLDPAARDAMLDVLERFIQDKNSSLRKSGKKGLK